MSDECREALVCASVIGREFDLPTLATAAGMDREAALDSLDEAVRARVLGDVPDGFGRFRFAHALMRETIYGELSPATRMRMHRRIGEVLEERYRGSVEAHLGELAHHFFEAAPLGEALRAADYAARAARRAMAGLGFEEAVRLYRLALRALDLAGGADATRIVLGLGEAQVRAGDVGGARTTFLHAAELARSAEDAEALATAALGVGGRFSWGRDSDPELVPLLEEALETLSEEDSLPRARLLSRMSGALRNLPSREPRASFSALAVDMARRLGDPGVLAYTLEGRWSAIWWVENPAERLVIANELVTAANASRDRERVFEGHLERGASLHELGRLAEADVEIELARRIAEELRQPALQWVISLHLGMRALSEGRFGEAEERIERTYRLGLGSVGADAIVGYATQRFLLRREQGRLAEVAGELAATATEHRTRVPLRAQLIYSYAALGRLPDARRALDELGFDRFDDLPRDNEWLFS